MGRNSKRTQSRVIVKCYLVIQNYLILHNKGVTLQVNLQSGSNNTNELRKESERKDQYNEQTNEI